MTKSRKSAKREIKALALKLMNERPTNHHRVVIELNTIVMICQVMGWEALRIRIELWLEKLDQALVYTAMTGGK